MVGRLEGVVYSKYEVEVDDGRCRTFSSPGAARRFIQSLTNEDDDPDYTGPDYLIRGERLGSWSPVELVELLAEEDG